MAGRAQVTVGDAIAAIDEHLARTRVEWAPVTPSTRLDDLDLDSLEIANVLLGLEEAKGCRLSLDSVADAVFVRDLAILEGQQQGAGIPQGEGPREE
jgi:acyl carrier protein